MLRDADVAELSVNDVKDALGVSVNVARARLRELVEQGTIVPTAPATSRLRRYKLASSA